MAPCAIATWARERGARAVLRTVGAAGCGRLCCERATMSMSSGAFTNSVRRVAALGWNILPYAILACGSRSGLDGASLGLSDQDGAADEVAVEPTDSSERAATPPLALEPRAEAE